MEENMKKSFLIRALMAAAIIAIIFIRTVYAYTFSALKTILEDSNSYTTIYLGADITMTEGITIPVSKTQLTIEGTSPLDSITTIYTLTEVQSVLPSQTIALTSSSSLQLTVKNMNIVGYNYYLIKLNSEVRLRLIVPVPVLRYFGFGELLQV